ncbi:hypothetical protein U9M48_026248 [Paspalum notatum var. saurae]|uniref:Uncharacterized protein n=1 Tax=Paspalum notatum var. saurae TaxID=547442 RepID=A0AAQ3TS45_PASNO
MALSNKKYQMIKAPGEREITDYRARYHLEKSEKGVYSALLRVDGSWPQFRVWFLNEAGGQMDWELRCNINLQALVESFPELSYDLDCGRLQEIPQQEEGPEWDFESGFIIDNNVKERKDCWHGAVFLGFHPYKEIAIFYLRTKDRMVYCHLSSAKVSELGIFDVSGMTSSFLYTPCWELFEEIKFVPLKDPLAVPWPEAHPSSPCHAAAGGVPALALLRRPRRHARPRLTALSPAAAVVAQAPWRPATATSSSTSCIFSSMASLASALLLDALQDGTHLGLCGASVLP